MRFLLSLVGSVTFCFEEDGKRGSSLRLPFSSAPGNNVKCLLFSDTVNDR